MSFKELLEAKLKFEKESTKLSFDVFRVLDGKKLLGWVSNDSDGFVPGWTARPAKNDGDYESDTGEWDLKKAYKTKEKAADSLK